MVSIDEDRRDRRRRAPSSPGGNRARSRSSVRLDGGRGLDGIGIRREIERDADGRPAVDARFGILVLRAQFDARDVADAKHGAVRIGPQHDPAELFRRRQRALGLNIHLELLVVADRPRADATDRRLNVLGLDRVDHVGRRQAEVGQALGVEPDAHGVVELAEQQGLADARDAGQLIENVQRRIAGDEDRRELSVIAVEIEELQDRRRSLDDRQPLQLHDLRKLRQRGLDAIVDVDGVDVGVRCRRRN